MKKYAPIVMLLIMVAACKKNGTTPSPSLTISGISDVTLQKTITDSASLNLAITYSDTTHDTIYLLVTGLPPNITMRPNTFLSGIPNFSTKLTFYDTSTTIWPPTGTYPITIYCNSSLFPQKKFTFNLTISQPPSIITTMLGVYKNCAFDAGVGEEEWHPYYIDSISADSIIPNRIYFHNYVMSGQTVYADVTTDSIPNQYNISIPTQIVGQSQMGGAHGFFKNDSIHIGVGSFPSPTNSGDGNILYDFNYITMGR